MPQDDIFLLLDEVPCNAFKRSGDWTGLNPNRVNLMKALKPIATYGNAGKIKLDFPEEVQEINLSRTFRYTHQVAKFLRVKYLRI